MYSSFASPGSTSETGQRSPDNQVSAQQMLKELERLCRDRQTGSLYLVSSEQHAGNFTLHEGRIVGIRYACQREERALMALQALDQVSYRFLAKKVSASEFQALPETYEILAQLGWSLDAPGLSAHANTAGTIAQPVDLPKVSPAAPLPPPPKTLNPFFSPTLPTSLGQDEVEAAIQPTVEETTENQTNATSNFETTGSRSSAPTKPAPKAPIPTASPPTTRISSESSAQFSSPSQRSALEHLATNYLGPVAQIILKKTLRKTQNADVVIKKLKQHIRDPQEANTFEQEARQLC